MTEPLHTENPPIPQAWNVPTENPHFVGREEMLQEIAELFEREPLKTVVITGPQGFGKSQVAKQFIYQNFPQYDVVWWFRANQYLKPQFERFAAAVAPYLGVPLPPSLQNIEHEHLISLIKEGIRRKNCKCLIVFDDAPTYAEMKPYVLFSHDKTVHTLITTKNGNFASNALHINPFKREDSLEYINLFLASEPDDKKDQLAKHFGDCPAALAISIDYIRSNPGMTIEHYLARHKAQKRYLPSLSLASQGLGSSVDDYHQDLLTAIQMNMKELDQYSEDASPFLSVLSLLHRDEIPLDFLEKWGRAKGVQTDITTLIRLVNQYSFVEVHESKSKKEAYLTMQDLIQELIRSQVPIPEKKKRIDEIAQILKETFSGRSDTVAESILRDNRPLLITLRISEIADQMGHHGPDLTFIRIRAFGVLMGLLRDYDKSRVLLDHLTKDLEKKVPFSKEDKILYNINLALFSALYETDYEKSIKLTKEALEISRSFEAFPEEHIRMRANLIQFHVLSGRQQECSSFVREGEKLLSLSASVPYNVLFIYATTLFFNDQGEIQKTIDVIRHYQALWDQQSFYPIMRIYILNQLAEALIKKEEIEAAQEVLALSEKFGKEFYGENQENGFFGNWHVLKAMCLFPEPQSFEAAKSFIQKGLQIQEKSFKGTDKHRHQAFAHLQLGRLFHLHHHDDQAKARYLASDAIFTKILKNQKVDDVSDLYKQLAILGIDTKDEALTNVYLKKQIAIFGLDHPRTKEIFHYLDEKGLDIPM